MKFLSMILALVCFLIVFSQAPAAVAALASDNEAQREMKRLMVEVEQIHRLEMKEQQRKVERLYRKLLPRIVELDVASNPDPGSPILEGRDKLAPEKWVEKAWSLDTCAFIYLLRETHRTCYHVRLTFLA